MPLVKEVSAEVAAKLAEEAKAKQKKRLEREAKAKPDTPPKIAPITQGKMLNLPLRVNVHGLKLTLSCPKFGKAIQIQEDIFVKWPNLCLFSAVGSPKGKGLEPDAILSAWNANNMATWRIEQESAPDVTVPEPTPATADDLREALTAIVRSLDAFLPAVCDSVWALGSESPGLLWPRVEDKDAPEGVTYLDDVIRNQYHVAELCDLLRVLLDVMGGFPGDVSERFLVGADEAQ